jgi:hypothetical protein
MNKMATEKVKTVTLHGVPYVINDKNELFFYGSKPLVQIGNWAPDTQIVSLLDDWESKAEGFVKTYRTQLNTHTTLSLENASQLQLGT